jgi:hypothetical protein
MKTSNTVKVSQCLSKRDQVYKRPLQVLPLHLNKNTVYQLNTLAR